MTLIKSISGIRGTIGGPSGENLTPPDVVKFTTAYVRLIAAPRAASPSLSSGATPASRGKWSPTWSRARCSPAVPT